MLLGVKLKENNMDLQQQVNNIASKGRYGDSMLMHVNPIEVEAFDVGLQRLAHAFAEHRLPRTEADGAFDARVAERERQAGAAE